MPTDMPTDGSVVGDRRPFRFDLTTMTTVHWAAAVLTAITGTVHVYLYLSGGFIGFLVAGLIFYAAIIGMTLNLYRRVLYTLGVPFTAGQMALWVIGGMPSFALGAMDKIVQLLLVIALIYLFLNEKLLTTQQATA